MATRPIREEREVEVDVRTFVGQVAHRNSSVGGGSVAAVTAAMAAALLEKVVRKTPATARRLQRRQHVCLKLAQQDAKVFFSVMNALRRKDSRAMRRSLKAATEIPCRVFEEARMIEVECRRARSSVNRRFQSDLTCAQLMARACAQSARILIHANLAWLNDTRYAAQVRRRLKAAQ